jgi:multicomponent Na+:H+ antiporter subunit C
MDFIRGDTVSLLLFFIGVYGLVARRNIIKSILSIGIMQAAAILYYLSADYNPDSVLPIGDSLQGQVIADPLPQALMITDIVIGIGITAAALILFIHQYHRFGTTNWLKARNKRQM